MRRNIPLVEENARSRFCTLSGGCTRKLVSAYMTARKIALENTAAFTLSSPFSFYKGISKYQNSVTKYLPGEKSKYSTLLAGVNNLNIGGDAPWLTSSCEPA